MNEAKITSLSDDDDNEKEVIEDKLTSSSPSQRDELKANGYCLLDNKYDISVVQGYIRNNFRKECMITGIVKMVIGFYSASYDEKIYTELVFVNKSSGNQIESKGWLVPKINLKLCNLLNAMAGTSRRIEIDSSKVKVKCMHTILRYLGHHKGIEPQPISSPLGSSDMKENVADEWDAQFVDEMDKKTIFQIILTCNYLDCKCLLQLCCAKIGSLIKGKPVDQVKHIIAR